MAVELQDISEMLCRTLNIYIGAGRHKGKGKVAYKGRK